jgi:hypothetical protein
MSEETDEAKKVIRNDGSIWHAVFEKVTEGRSKAQVDESLLKAFF